MAGFLASSSSYWDWRHYIPESWICLRAGYTSRTFLADLMAGIGLGILALPINMAFAIACGLPPEVGLYTAIVAGFLTSLLGGSTVAIGGPTGAFVVIIYSIIERHGYEGLAMATLMAGGLLILMGLARFGVMLKFISYPVITGFTTGIAVVIMSLQVKSLLGLHSETEASAHFLSVCYQNWMCIRTTSGYAVGVAAVALAMIIAIRRWAPKAPAYLIAVFATALAVDWFELPVQTIGSKFGEMPNSLPSPHIPWMSWHQATELLPDAITIALLSGLESLLCALVADGMIGTRHKSDCELVAQGFANIGSVLFGGIPATGAIARTAANIRMGGRTPVAGMIHALVMLLIMIYFAAYAKLIPLPALAAIMFVVAWQMSELDRLRDLLRGPRSDVAIFLISFLLTVLVDLTVAVQVGIILSTLHFIKHMSDRMTASAYRTVLHEKDRKGSPLLDPESIETKTVPDYVTVFEIHGPLFFGVADLLHEAIRRLENRRYETFILRMRYVPLIDATGMRALTDLHHRCRSLGMVLCLSEVNEYVHKTLQRAELDRQIGTERIFPSIDAALRYASHSPMLPH